MHTFGFPLDIERSIFEEAAMGDKKIAVMLSHSICRTVQCWWAKFLLMALECQQRTLFRVEPILYRTVSLNFYTIDRFVKCLKETHKPLSFYACVKALYIRLSHSGMATPSALTLILSFCTEVVDFGLVPTESFRGVYQPGLLPSISILQLRQVTIRLADIFLRAYSTTFSHPFFRHITHLYILDPGDLWQTLSTSLHLLPTLTHLGLVMRCIASGDGGFAAEALGTMFQQCSRLLVCVVLLNKHYWAEIYVREKMKIEHIPDHRLVIFNDNQIFKGEPYYLRDPWRLAEDIVEEQRVTQKRRIPRFI